MSNITLTLCKRDNKGDKIPGPKSTIVGTGEEISDFYLKHITKHKVRNRKPVKKRGRK